jgi:hypothetical protein
LGDTRALFDVIRCPSARSATLREQNVLVERYLLTHQGTEVGDVCIKVGTQYQLTMRVGLDLESLELV